MRGSALNVSLLAHAGDRVALPLPEIEDNTVLSRVRVDGRPIDSVRRHDATDWVSLPRGVHLVELESGVSGSDTFLHFSLPPMRVIFDGQGWQANGIDEDRLINQTVPLSRVTALPGTAEQWQDGGAQQFPPYVRIRRTLRFDLDWSVNSTLARISPREGGMTLAVPLLAGEHVTTPGVRVQDGQATVSLGQNEAETSWQSRLDKSQTLRLTATVTPANATNRNVTWTSSNTAAATVNASGLVTAVAPGTTTITARTAAGNHTASVTIRVQAPGNDFINSLAVVLRTIWGWFMSFINFFVVLFNAIFR
jgi:hypothetical protein